MCRRERPGAVRGPAIGGYTSRLKAKRASNFRLLTLGALVRMKLTSFRDKDRTHLRDMFDVGLLDGSWSTRLPSELAERLQQLIDNPE